MNNRKAKFIRKLAGAQGDTPEHRDYTVAKNQVITHPTMRDVRIPVAGTVRNTDDTPRQRYKRLKRLITAG